MSESWVTPELFPENAKARRKIPITTIHAAIIPARILAMDRSAFSGPPKTAFLNVLPSFGCKLVTGFLHPLSKGL